MQFLLRWLILPFYLILMALIVFVTVLNTKRLRHKYSFDSLPIIMVLYIFHVYFVLGFIKGGIYVLAPTSLMLLAIVINFYKVQVIGVTGGIGSGKSTVSKILNEQFKLPLIDCDILSRRVVEVGKPAYNKIVKIFGTKVLDEKTKEINRKVLGEIVFNDKKLRSQLTRTTGWYISLEIFKEIFVFSRVTREPIVLDAPILFESQYLKYLCFPIIVTYLKDTEKQIKRVVERGGLSKDEAIKRLQSQMPTEKKLAMADIGLKNEGDVEDLKKSLINQLYPYIM